MIETEGIECELLGVPFWVDIRPDYFYAAVEALGMEFGFELWRRGGESPLWAIAMLGPVHLSISFGGKS